jgi:hypothetical protein
MAQPPFARQRCRFSGLSTSRWLAGLVLSALLLLVWPAAANAAELRVSEVTLEPCPPSDVAAQPDQNRSTSARCYALRGMVENPGRQPVVDTDVFARILDASGEPVLQNRTRVGSIGDVPPGRSPFALRLAVPAGTPDPLGFTSVKARGFSSPVRTRAGEGDDLLPLERALQP